MTIRGDEHKFIRKGKVVPFKTKVGQVMVTGTGAVTAQAPIDAETVSVKVKTTSNAQLLPVDSYQSVTLDKSKFKP